LVIKEKELKKGDYVVAIRDIDSIKKNSVGLVAEISENIVTVFFIGAIKTIEVKKDDIAYLDITKTGKGYKYKICNICHILKDYFKDFAINQTDAKGQKTTRPTCKDCRIEMEGVPLNAAEKRRMEAIKPKGVYTCPICQKTSIVGITAKFVIDHDHKTGKAREWICDSCNTGLGRFKDDPEIIRKAIDYLKKYS